MLREKLFALLLGKDIVLFDDGEKIHVINNIWFEDGTIMCTSEKGADTYEYL